MRVNVEVKFGNISTEFLLHCGDGKKTIKWLALTASQRFSSGNPRGAPRCREKKNLAANRSHYLPSNVSNSNKGLLRPDEFIEDVLNDDEDVVVELAPQVSVCPLGNPEFSTWAILAFAQTENQRKMHARAQAIRAVDEEEEKREQHHQILLQDAHKIAEKASSMRNVLAKQLPNETKNKAEAQVEWEKILEQNLLKKILVNNSDEEKIRIFELLEENFYYFSALFRHFCAIGAGDATHTIEFHEFTTAVHELGIFETKPSHHLLHKVFADSSEKVRAGGNTTIELRFHEFFVALLRLSLEKNAPRTRMFKYSHPIHDLFKTMLEEAVVPFVDCKIQGGDIHSVFSSNEILALLYDYNLDLLEVFEKYAASVEDDPSFGVLKHDTMNISEFQILLHDAGLLRQEKSKHSQLMSMKNLRQVFATSQSRITAEFISEEEVESTIGHNDDQQMDYPEYLEALIRVALHTHQENLSSNTKIENLLQLVCGLLKKDEL